MRAGKPGSRTSAISSLPRRVVGAAEVSPPGKLIVIDGTDGSGKKTQAQLLTERFQKEGYPVVSVSFPQYGKKSAGLVEEYLNGKYGKASEVDPYTASLFYALDRFDLSGEIKKALAEEKIIITDRYVDANAGHQGGKIKNIEERKKFISWLHGIEYNILGIPRPDMVFILHIPPETGQRLVLEKQQRPYIEEGGKMDLHESDIEHLKAAEAAYMWLAEQYPQDHRLIGCAENGRLLSREEIHEKLWQEVLPLVGTPMPEESELITEKL